jgi:hypothetical protein
MAILRTGWERLKGAFEVLLGGAAAVGIADLLKGVLKEKGVETGIEFIKSLATGKGLANEATYGYILDKCKLKTDERSLLIHAIEELRKGTKQEKEAANNFIIAVALCDQVGTCNRPGEQIIHGFVHRISEYPTEAEKIQMIKDNVIHIGTNAEIKNKVAIVQKWALEAWHQLESFFEQVNKTSKKYNRSSAKALRDFNQRPLWKKILLN